MSLSNFLRRFETPADRRIREEKERIREARKAAGLPPIKKKGVLSSLREGITNYFAHDNHSPSAIRERRSQRFPQIQEEALEYRAAQREEQEFARIEQEIEGGTFDMPSIRAHKGQRLVDLETFLEQQELEEDLDRFVIYDGDGPFSPFSDDAPTSPSYVQKLSKGIEKAAISAARFIPDIINVSVPYTPRVEDDIPVFPEERLIDYFKPEEHSMLSSSTKKPVSLLSKVSDYVNKFVEWDRANLLRVQAYDELSTRQKDTSKIDVDGVVLDLDDVSSKDVAFAQKASKDLNDALSTPTPKKQYADLDTVNNSIDALATQPKPKRDFDPVAFDRQLRNELGPIGAVHAYIAQQKKDDDRFSEMLANRFVTRNKKSLATLSEEDQVRATQLVLQEHRLDYMGGMSPAKILAKADKELYERWRSPSTKKDVLDDIVVSSDPLSLVDTPASNEPLNPKNEFGRSPYFGHTLDRIGKWVTLGSGAAAATIALGMSISNMLTQEPAYEQPQTTVVSSLEDRLEPGALPMYESATESTATHSLPDYVPAGQIAVEDLVTLSVYDTTPEYVFDERAPDSPIEVTPLPEPIDDIITVPEPPYEQATLALSEDTNKVPFNAGDSAWNLLSARGCQGNDLVNAIKQAGIDNNWYAESRIQNGSVSGNPLQFDTQPKAGGQYLLTTCSQEPSPEPNGTAPFTPTNGIGVLAALGKTFDLQGPEKMQALVMTGIHNNLYGPECLIDGEFNFGVCNPIQDIRPWRAGQEYTLVRPK